ncbi:MAG: SGNH/GDSL hydrolase family protein [Lachnospiraceae bacterium]|nr:SGNH/GDSL hydrolase family protein [Lachnospiraceae bacterium]
MKPYIKKTILLTTMTLIISLMMIGCGRNNAKENLSENIPLEENTPAPEEEKIDILEIVELIEPDTKQDIEDEFDLPDPNPHPLQIVFLGESNLDAYRDETGIAYLVGKNCDATIYNLSITGTTVAVRGEEDPLYSEEKNLRSLVGMSNILAGKADVKGIEGTRASELVDGLRIENTDYFVIMYGAQDFIRGIPLDNPPPEYEGGIDTYVGALRKAIANLREVAPLADFVLCAPHYSQFFDENNIFIGDGHVLSNGHSFLYDYKGKVEYVANEQKAIFLNAFQDLGIDGHTAADFLEDGVHLSEKGRQLYAERLAKMILNHEEEFYN